MKKKFWDLGKCCPPHRGAINRGLLKAFKGLLLRPPWSGPDFKQKTELFFHSSGSKPNCDKPQKMGRLFSLKYEFGTPVGTRNLPKSENRDFRWLLISGIFGVGKLVFRFFAIFVIFDM